MLSILQIPQDSIFKISLLPTMRMWRHVYVCWFLCISAVYVKSQSFLLKMPEFSNIWFFGLQYEDICSVFSFLSKHFPISKEKLTIRLWFNDLKYGIYVFLPSVTVQVWPAFHLNLQSYPSQINMTIPVQITIHQGTNALYPVVYCACFS